jgi:hypothetical protein
MRSLFLITRTHSCPSDACCFPEPQLETIDGHIKQNEKFPLLPSRNVLSSHLVQCNAGSASARRLSGPRRLGYKVRPSGQRWRSAPGPGQELMLSWQRSAGNAAGRHDESVGGCGCLLGTRGSAPRARNAQFLSADGLSGREARNV